MSPPSAPPPEVASRIVDEIDAWIAGCVERSGLALRDVRRGVQSVSSVYVEGRGAGRLGARASGGPARRAALSSYYAPLHFLTVLHAVASLADPPPQPRRVVDLGCGTGACGAALALATNPGAPILGIDLVGASLAEARHTYAAFGVRGRTRRASLPKALPRLRAGDALVAGWMLNELDAAGRETLLEAFGRAGRDGASVLVLEPLSGRVSPWWDEAARKLAAFGFESSQVKTAIDRPEWIAALDQASGLDHREIGARILAGPIRAEGQS